MPSNSNGGPNLLAASTNTGEDLSDSQMFQDTRKLLDTVNKLQSTGVHVDIDLPQSVIIGNQSSGKSSVVEAICGIPLPRAAGTCTRCPTECRLSFSEAPWQCTVSLHVITDANGLTLGQARNEQFGGVIYEKSLVEERVRRAQLAILNPNVPSKTFLDCAADTDVPDGQLSFSHNAVCLQISGKDVPDLSFCDLPGLIATGDDIALVQDLVISYIKKTSCIILLTVACEADFEVQGAHRLAKQFDPDGKRTIGVLTKADRIPIGEEDRWLPFIRNEKEALKNNWFCVKQPSSDELKSNPTWADVRKMENDFFSNAPWYSLESNHQKLLRTNNLVERLSTVLSDLISKRLPQVQDEVGKSIMSTRALLAQLPTPPSADPRGEIMTMLHKFTSDLELQVKGVSDADDSDSEDDVGLIQAMRPAQERFRMAIRGTAPNFRPFERNDAGKKHLRAAAFLKAEEGRLPDGEASDGEDEKDDAGGERDADGGAQLTKEGLVSNGSISGKSQRMRLSTEVIYVDEVLDKARRARTRELPGNFPFSVQKSIIDKVIKKWHAPTQVLCRAVHTIVLEHLKKLIKKHFAEFGQGHLEQRVRAIIQQHMKTCLERAQERIVWLLQLEDLPFSLNTHYLEDYKSKFFAHYKGSRAEYNRADLMNAIREYESRPTPTKVPKQYVEPMGVSKILVGLAEISVRGIQPEDLAKLLPPDRMEPALIIMADVRAYFQVAYKRFADAVPLAIDRDLVCGAASDVLPYSTLSLGVNGPEGARVSRCRHLAQESPQDAERIDLQKKLERLETATRAAFHLD